VGSSKSTIARLLKKGVEDYSRTPDGALYTFTWTNLEGTGMVSEKTEGGPAVTGLFPCPMHEEPLRLIPMEWRERAVKELGLGDERVQVRTDGDLDPACRFIFKSLLERYKGDWARMIANHIRVRRILLSEKDRVGVGTFQPKDEKNQDSTELTGDINYRKIAEYGSDSDPRAFNFDGEFCVANRGRINARVGGLKLSDAKGQDGLT
jgi:serine protein kinase